jgi:pimeloyl-ACP methyl ester carboxylesterase
MLAQGIPGAQLRIVDGAGHFMLWTHPDVVLHTIEAFLATVHGKETVA